MAPPTHPTRRHRRAPARPAARAEHGVKLHCPGDTFGEAGVQGHGPGGGDEKIASRSETGEVWVIE